MGSQDCSVDQGSKLSSLLYIISTNEIPLLYKRLNTPIFTKLTIKENNNDYNISYNNYEI